MVCRTEQLVCALAISLAMCQAPGVLAQSATDSPPASPGADLAPDSGTEGTPSIEFLEFLGQWETDEGEWIAPQDLADDEFAQLINTALDTEPEKSD